MLVYLTFYLACHIVLFRWRKFWIGILNSFLIVYEQNVEMMLDLFSVLDSSEHANVYVYFLPFNLHFAGDEMTRVIWKMIKDKVIFFLVKYLD